MEKKKTDRILSQKKNPAKNQKLQFDVVVWFRSRKIRNIRKVHSEN